MVCTLTISGCYHYNTLWLHQHCRGCILKMSDCYPDEIWWLSWQCMMDILEIFCKYSNTVRWLSWQYMVVILSKLFGTLTIYVLYPDISYGYFDNNQVFILTIIGGHTDIIWFASCRYLQIICTTFCGYTDIIGFYPDNVWWLFW